MSYRYGFELEGFWTGPEGIIVPPSNYPHDGFPGLIEFRSVGGKFLEEAWSDLLCHMSKYDLSGFETGFATHTFTPDQKRAIRKVGATKDACDVQNLYGKKPRNLGGKTIASLQINISNCVRSEYRESNGTLHQDAYSILDVGKIVKALDKTFATEIKESGRQRGEYAIKGDRLEYRSLPNTIFTWNHRLTKMFLDRIRNAVEKM